MKKLDWEVSPAIAGHYEVVNTTFPILESRIGRIDFRVITLDQANRIHELGSRYLKKIAKESKNNIKKSRSI